VVSRDYQKKGSLVTGESLQDWHDQINPKMTVLVVKVTDQNSMTTTQNIPVSGDTQPQGSQPK